MGFPGGYIQSTFVKKGAEEGSAAQAAAQKQATAAKQDFFKQGIASAEPFRGAGAQALGGLSDIAFRQGVTPETELALEQNTKALNRRQAAGGFLRSGQGLQQFGDVARQTLAQGQSQQENYLRQVRDIGFGQTSSNIANAAQTGSRIGGLYSAGGQLAANAANANAAAQGQFYGGIADTATTLALGGAL